MLDRQRYTLPPDLAAKVTDVVADWQKSGKARRLWARDATLWTGSDEGHWLDWLGITDDQVAHSGPLKEVAQEVANAGVSHAVLLGMGGSSLCPEVMRKTFGTIKGFPELHVLDSTDPAQIAAIEHAVDLDAHALHRLEQVRHDTRTQHPAAVLPDTREARGRRGTRGRPFHRHHRSRLGAPPPRRARAVPSGVLRGAGHRRPLFGALELRPGPGGADGRRRRTAARPHGTDGAFLCGERPRRRESGGRPGRDPGHAGRRRP